MARSKTYTQERKPKKSSKPKKKRKYSFPQLIYRVIVIVFAAALLLAYLSVWIDPAFFPIPYYFGLYFVPLFFINLVFLLIGLFKMKNYLVISLIALLPSIIFAERFVKVGKEEKSIYGDEVKVMSWNVGRFRCAAKGMNQAEAYAKVCDFLQRESPDILCLQECLVTDTTSVGRIIKSLPYTSQRFFKESGRYFGNVTFSRYPIVNSGYISFTKSANLCIWCDLRINDVTVRVYNCHLQSNGFSFTEIIRKLSQKGKFTDEVKDVHERLLKTALQRSEQVSKIGDDIKACPIPTMVCGDFNDTPMSYTYQHLVNGHKDSFIEGGTGFSATYSALWPLLRIDYIMIPDDKPADRTTISRVPFSDHYPVSTLVYF